MKKLLIIVLLPVLLGCNDGDIIVTTFDFSETELQACTGSNAYLFFKINSGNTESISVRLAITEDQFTSNNVQTSILNGTTNFANYRVYNGTVTNSYFCNEIPPTDPEVTIEYVANSGTATLTTTSLFDDNDTLPFIVSNDTLVEGNGDLDRDGLANYYDFDDDGDNVPTRDELDTENADGDNDPLTNPLDTDGDGVPNHLDPDDDGDGVLTRYEANGTLDPTQFESGVGGPDYLNPAVANEVVINEFREHNYDFDSAIDLILNNLVLVNGEEQITRETLDLGQIDPILTGNILITPEFPEN